MVGDTVPDTVCHTVGVTVGVTVSVMVSGMVASMMRRRWFVGSGGTSGCWHSQGYPYIGTLSVRVEAVRQE